MSDHELATIGLDPAWLQQALTSDGVAPTEVVFDGFIGTGQMSRNARFRLRWPTDAASGTERPGSVVVKVPSGEAATRAVSFEHKVYVKECDFYRSVAQLVDVAAPDSMAVHFDPDAADFAVVLEDLNRSAQGDQFTEPTADQLNLAVAQAAALHAPVWGRTGGSTFDLYRTDPAERSARSAEFMPLFLAAVLDRLGSGLEPDVVELLQRYADTASQWAAVETPAATETLVHGDFRPDNFMFATDPSAPPLVVVDWQTLTLGLGVTDIAYLLGAAVEPENRRRIEADLLARYVSELAGRGVDYPLDQCRNDYAYGSLHGIGIAMTATVMADVTERGDALFTLMLNRHGRHALDMAILDRFD